VKSTGASLPASEDGQAPGGQGRPGKPANRYRVEALAKGLHLLSLFSPERPALRVKELADLSGQPVPSVFRLVSTLAEEGYLERLPDGRVRPGTGVLTLGFASLQGMDLVQTSASVMTQLGAATNATVNLGVLFRDSVLFVAREQSRTSLIAANIRVGSTVPAVYSSIGKVLLAHLSPEDFERRITDESFSGAWGPRAVRDRTALMRQLESVRLDGYLIQEEESVAGLSSLAAPVLQAGQGVVAAINVAVPTRDYPQARILRELREPLLTAAGTISRRLGATTPA
jgi:IclR family transcriptional regulator, pca regulon regulatory protein